MLGFCVDAVVAEAEAADANRTEAAGSVEPPRPRNSGAGRVLRDACFVAKTLRVGAEGVEAAGAVGATGRDATVVVLAAVVVAVGGAGALAALAGWALAGRSITRSTDA